jgi:hypothetical protein
MNARLFFLVALFVGIAPLARAQAQANAPSGSQAPVARELRFWLDPEAVAFGAPFTLAIEWVRSDDERVSLPEAMPENDGVRIAARPRRQVVEEPSLDPGPGLVRERLFISYLAVDYESVKTPEVVLKTNRGEALEIPSLPVKVAMPPGMNRDAGPEPDLNMADTRGAVVYRIRDLRPWIPLSSLLGAALGLVGLSLFERRRRLPELPTRPQEREVATEPLHRVFLARLDALLARDLLQRGAVDAFTTELMNQILRPYLELRFAVPAEKRTTRELIEVLVADPAAGLDLGAMEGLLADADLVKYARAQITPVQCHGMAQRVRRLIEESADDSKRMPVSASESSGGLG